ncbi:PEP-CTERM sorting domain-containing protein [Sphingomonas paeninsulae]|uniref:PEP-CTERM sorting domain-containing protein n=2 Tax=Sphingomonas paeninsulae TaxID=2319844 RepID=A0A494TKS7_SPHPE|nr:PEP-CTERM sorting domain-containing protein [Sphingomonas paeninsulae]
MGGGSAIVKAVFGSTQAAFEIDNLVTAAPEPATWGMMILGFGLAGAQLRSRRRSAKLAVA